MFIKVKKMQDMTKQLKTNNITVSISDMRLSDDTNDVIVTHSLGSCIGISIYDPIAKVGGILHYQLPLSKFNKEKALLNPFMFADTGIPAFFNKAFEMGAKPENIIIKIAGGACSREKDDFFDIGNRNYIILKKIFWKYGLFIDSEDIGGNTWRTMRLEIKTGKVSIKKSESAYEL